MAESRRPHDRLVDEVVSRDECTLCGACATQCAAEGDAVDVGPAGITIDSSLCTECRSCLALCPQLVSADAEIEARAGPGRLGTIAEAGVYATGLWRVRAVSASGVVTSLLTHLLETRAISGVVVPAAGGVWGTARQLVTTPEELLAATGNRVGKASTIRVNEGRVANLSILASLRELHAANPRSGDLAVVALPCEAYTIARMRLAGVLPANRIRLVIGLFCLMNLPSNAFGVERLATAAGIRLGSISSVRFGEGVTLTNEDGESRALEWEQALPAAPPNCRACLDITAKHADISVGVGPAGFSTVLARTPAGRNALLAATKAGYLRSIQGAYVDAPPAAESAAAIVADLTELLGKKTLLVAQ